MTQSNCELSQGIVAQAEGADGRVMRVLHLASGGLWGGAEAQLTSVTKELTRLVDVEVRTVIFNHGVTEERLRQAGVDVTVFDEARLNTVQLLRRLIAFMRQWRPDFIHTHGYKECVLGSVAALLSGRVRCLRTVHGWMEWQPKFWQLHKRLIRTAELISFRAQRGIVAVSAELGQRLFARLRHKQIVVIENGIDIEQLEHARRAVSTAPGHVLRIGFVGRLFRVKRADLFLQVCKLLHAEVGADMKFVIAGDGPLLNEVRQLTRELGLQDYVELPGFVADVATCLTNVDALIITSDHEGLPTVLLEAMALRVPVVAHAVGGIPEALAHGACGVLVPDQAPPSYVRAIKDLFADRAATTQMTERAYRRALGQYSDRRVAREYRELYLRLLSAE